MKACHHHNVSATAFGGVEAMKDSRDLPPAHRPQSTCLDDIPGREICTPVECPPWCTQALGQASHTVKERPTARPVPVEIEHYSSIRLPSVVLVKHRSCSPRFGADVRSHRGVGRRTGHLVLSSTARPVKSSPPYFYIIVGLLAL